MPATRTLIPEMAQIQVTVALLPVSGTYVMTADEAFEAAKVIQAEYFVPMHYGDIVGGEGDVEKFRYLCEGQGIRVAVLSTSEDPVSAASAWSSACGSACGAPAARARELKAWTYALYGAYRDPRVPWYARAFALCVVAYAFSPIDLVPDFVPVLGYLDDLILIPLGIALAIRMIPAGVLAEHRERGRALAAEGKSVDRVAAGVIVLIWLALLVVGFLLVQGPHAMRRLIDAMSSASCDEGPHCLIIRWFYYDRSVSSRSILTSAPVPPGCALPVARRTKLTTIANTTMIASTPMAASHNVP